MKQLPDRTQEYKRRYPARFQWAGRGQIQEFSLLVGEVDAVSVRHSQLRFIASWLGYLPECEEPRVLLTQRMGRYRIQTRHQQVVVVRKLPALGN